MNIKVRTSDCEWFDVVFEQGEPVSVTRSQVVWSGGKPRAISNMMMSQRVKNIVALAKDELDGTLHTKTADDL